MTSPYDFLMPKYKVKSIEELMKEGFSKDEAALIQWRDQKTYEAVIAQSVLEMRGQLELYYKRLGRAENEAKWLACKLASLKECPDKKLDCPNSGDCVRHWLNTACQAVEDQC